MDRSIEIVAKNFDKLLFSPNSFDIPPKKKFLVTRDFFSDDDDDKRN